MRTLKLAIWDLDHTILEGVFQEGDETINPKADKIMSQLNEVGILQALATQNQPEIISAAITKFEWIDIFVQIEADLGSKVKKVDRILGNLGISPLDTVFIDEDPFERDSIFVQIPDITTWSIAQMAAHLKSITSPVTEESRRRLKIYSDQQARLSDEKKVNNYTEFLHSCNIQIKIRPFVPDDALRAEELLTRTHQMNLGVLPVEEAVKRLDLSDDNHVIMAEMTDVYGDMGRTGIIHLRPCEDSSAHIESLAISCRTRARGLSLAMLIGLLRHPLVDFQTYCCRFVNNGFNRPLRMLLLGAGFKPQPGSNKLVLTADRLAASESPDWVNIGYEELAEEVK